MLKFASARLYTSERKTLHSTRHTLASHLVMGGTDIGAVQKILGHSSITVTKVYANVTTEHLKTQIGKLDFGGGKP